MKGKYKIIVGLLSLFFLMFDEWPSMAQTYYVSSSIGDNRNDGLTEKTPKKDLTGISKKDVTILLRCGDVFWGGLSGYTDCTISSYGKGDRPVICGFKILKNTNAWKPIGGGLWRLDLSLAEDFVGNVETKSNGVINNIGFIYDASNEKLYGHNVKSIDSLNNEMDFYTSSYYAIEDIEKHPFNYVYIKTSNNPSTMGNLCFPMYQSAVSDMKNCCLEGLAFVGFSRMGVVRCKGCVIQDCQIDMIGGAIFLGYNTWCRYGNGVEFWYQYVDNTVKNCLISRTYDCATTIQANGDIMSNPRNIHFIGNRLYKCRQAFEHFLNPKDGRAIAYENCEFSNNVCYLMGENEFDSPELRDCNILSYESQPVEIKIEGNVFFGANHLDGSNIGPGMKSNTIYLYENQYLYIRHWMNNKNLVHSNNRTGITQYRQIAQDRSKIKVLKRGSKKAKRIENRILNEVAWKPVNLKIESVVNQ